MEAAAAVLAVLSELSDFTFVEEKNGKLFVNSPNALDGNNDIKLDTASAAFQAEAGVADFTGERKQLQMASDSLYLFFRPIMTM